MKSLIIYSTKYGFAEKSAKILKSKMSSDADLVNVMKEKVPALDSYDNVILGGSIYIGRIQKELINYVTANMPVLLKKKVGLFICAGSPEEASRQKELETVFPSELYNHAVSKELFGYELAFEKLGFLDKLIMKTVKGDKNSISEILEDNIENLANIMSSAG